MLLDEIVCGSPGSGEPHCYGLHRPLPTHIHRQRFNPDPANDNIPGYPCAIDSSSLITPKDIMESWKNINSYHSAHAHSLQTFVEKVTVFLSATKHKDEDLTQTSLCGDEPAKIYKLAQL